MLDGVKLTRIDYRLIHGQVITKWTNKAAANRIIVVNDELAKDKFMASVYTMSAPPGVKVQIATIDQFVKASKKVNSSLNKGNILILFRSIADVLTASEAGVQFKSIQVGGLGSGDGKGMVVKGIFVSATDISELEKIHAKGSEVTFQVTPEEPRLSLDRAKAKVGGE